MQSHEMPAVMRDDSALLADGIGQHIFIRNLQVCLTGLLDGQHIMTKLAQGEGAGAGKFSSAYSRAMNHAS